MTLSFTDTRARSTDDTTSKDAAKNAASGKADRERHLVGVALRVFGSMTARELSSATGIDYITVQRRISEVAGIEKTDEVRQGCRVWRCIA